MNQEAYQSITKMLNAFPQSAANVTALLLTYDEALTSVPDRAIVEAASRFTRGTVEGQNRTFAPSIAEFCEQARKIAEVMAIRSRPRIEAPQRQTSGLAPFEVNRNRLLAENRHRHVLRENVSWEEFRALHTTKRLPVGCTWVAGLATIYGKDGMSEAEAIAVRGALNPKQSNQAA